MMSTPDGFTLYGFTIPNTSPLLDPSTSYMFCGSLVILHASYHGLANTIFKGEEKDKLKARSWILTTIASLVMSLASMPYLFDLAVYGPSLSNVKLRMNTVANPLACFFVAYLLSDLLLGAIYYRKLINMASGWIHHSVYTILFTYVYHKQWTYIAAIGAIFELPTFVMGIASMFPKLRSNMGFTVTFFITRIFFHFAIMWTLATPSGREAPFVDGSWVPCMCISLPFPMHLWWGYKAIRSMQRRAAKRKLQKQTRVESDHSVVVSTGQFFNGLAPPDVTSALNTPATTPGSSAGARGETNFGSTSPVNSAFARAVAAAGVTARPMRLFIGRRDKPDRLERSSSVSSTSSVESTSYGSGRRSRLSGRTTPLPDEMIAQNPFTAPIAPEGADPDAKEPFLAIRSPAETSDRARRLIADAVRKAWTNAPETWRKQVEQEARMRPNSNRFNARGRSKYVVAGAEGRESDPSYYDDAEDEEEGVDGVAEFDDALSELIDSPLASPRAEGREGLRDRVSRAAARRAVIRAVRRAINGRNADGQEYDTDNPTQDRTLSPVDFSALLKRLPPNFLGQDYQVGEFPVERDESDSRRKRIMGQIRRRIQVARRDVMVFDS